MSVKFNYDETSDVLTINDNGNVTVYQFHKNKYGKLFRYIIKAIDELDNPNYTTKSMNIYLNSFYAHHEGYRADPTIVIDASKTYNVTFDEVTYSNLTPWVADGEQNIIGLGNPLYTQYNLKLTSDLPFAILSGYDFEELCAGTGGSHSITVEEVGGSSATVTYELELIEPEPQHDQDLDIDVFYNKGEVYNLFKVDPNMTYLVTFNGVAKELQLAPISGADGVYTLGSIATDNFTIQIWKMQGSDSYNFAMVIPASIWTDHSVATDFIVEVSYEE